MDGPSTPASDILKPSEALPGTGVPFLNFTFHVGEIVHWCTEAIGGG